MPLYITEKLVCHYTSLKVCHYISLKKFVCIISTSFHEYATICSTHCALPKLHIKIHYQEVFSHVNVKATLTSPTHTLSSTQAPFILPASQLQIWTIQEGCDDAELTLLQMSRCLVSTSEV